MRPTLRILPFVLLGLFVGCHDLPTDTQQTDGAAAFARGDKKPPKDPPGGGGGSADPAIAYLNSSTLMVMNEDGSEQTVLIDGVARTVSWSPDGQGLAYKPDAAGDFSTIMIADLALSDGVPVLAGTTDLLVPHAGPPSWSPLGDLIAYPGFCPHDEPDNTCPPEGFMNHVRAVPVTRGTAYTVFEAPCVNRVGPDDCWILSTAWSPDGTQIAFVEASDGWNAHALQVVDVGSAPTQVSQVLIEPGALEFICNPDWSPDGSRIAFWGREPGNSAPNLFDFHIGSESPPEPLGLTSNHSCEDVSWSPDGTRWIVSQDGGIRIVGAVPGTSSYGKVIPKRRSKLASGYSPAWRPCAAGTTGCGLAP